jgi:Flp pilus assembly protein TadD/TolB-like protein
MEVLVCLASSAGEFVERETLIDKVWGTGHGSPKALSQTVSKIRHALDDHPDNPKFVQTLPKRGYRLIVEAVPKAAHTVSSVPGTQDVTSVGDLDLFENFKKRGVLGAAVAYLIVGWLLIQIADIVFDQLLLPSWAGTFVTVLVIAGFPIALALSWYLEFRDGRVVLHELSPEDAKRRQFSRTYLSVIGAMAIAAVIVYAYDRNIGLPEAPIPDSAAISEEIVLPPILDNTIAVLPLLNVDGSDETQIFANGLTDDVITRLSRVPGLLVSSRGDAFTLNPNTASKRVRERLRVARYIEGSVQMAGEQMRIIVQLIDSETGFHVLSRTFDRPREDFFDVRDEITELTVANVRVTLPPETQAASIMASDDPSLDAYVLYRRGIEQSYRPKIITSLETALAWYDAALEVDPDYAAAHAGKCAVFADAFREFGDTVYIDNANASCRRALDLNPNLDVVHTALGDLYSETGEYSEAEEAYLNALEIVPNSVVALTGLGNTYMGQQNLEAAEERFRQAVGQHPGDWSAYNMLGNFLFDTGRHADAAEEYKRVIALDNDNTTGYSNLGTAIMQAGDFSAALPSLKRAIELEPLPTTYSNLGLNYYYLGRLDEAIDNHRQAVELAPKDHLLWSNLGDALWIAGNIDEAREAFETAEEAAAVALQVNPNDQYIYIDLAWISAMLDKHAEARALIERVRTKVDNSYLHYIDGLILLRGGNAGAAMSALELAVAKGHSREVLAADPHLASIHGNPRFSAILERR